MAATSLGPVTTRSPGPAKSYSGSQPVPLVDKLREAAALARMIRRRGHGEMSFAWVDEYDELLQQHTGKRLAGATALELGFGARPIRLLTLLGLGVDVHGVDRDLPAAVAGWRGLPQIARENGLERVLKTAGRMLLERDRYREIVSAELARRGGSFREAGHRLVVGDLGDPGLADRLGPRRFDLVYSEDVLEHVPAAALPTALDTVAAVLAPDGIAVLRPNVFTGINGGHLPEWYPSALDDGRPKRTEPWEHLRQRRVRANTYLNELTRADYRRLLTERFTVLDEKVMQPDLGRHLLTPEVRAELADYPDEELFSNNVRWVLRAKEAR